MEVLRRGSTDRKKYLRYVDPNDSKSLKPLTPPTLPGMPPVKTSSTFISDLNINIINEVLKAKKYLEQPYLCSIQTSHSTYTVIGLLVDKIIYKMRIFFPIYCTS